MCRALRWCQPPQKNLSRDLQAAAHAIRVQTHVLHANTEQHIDTAFATIVWLRAGGLSNRHRSAKALRIDVSHDAPGARQRGDRGNQRLNVQGEVLLVGLGFSDDRRLFFLVLTLFVFFFLIVGVARRQQVADDSHEVNQPGGNALGRSHVGLSFTDRC